MKDITGMKFGEWTVLNVSHKNKSGAYMFNCICSCGTKRIVNGTSLRIGSSKNCGCIKEIRIPKGFKKDFTGLKFNQFEVMSFAYSKYTHSYWNCKCSCNEIEILPIVNIGKKIKCNKCLKNGLDVNSLLEPNEIIKPVEGLKDYYVTNFGKIYSNKKSWIELKQSTHNRI